MGPKHSISMKESVLWCDQAKWVGTRNAVFKIQPNKADSFFSFLLFVHSFNCLYLWNYLPNLCGVFTKLKPKQYPNRKCQKPKIIFFDFRLILLDRITFLFYCFIGHFFWSSQAIYFSFCGNSSQTQCFQRFCCQLIKDQY